MVCLGCGSDGPLRLGYCRACHTPSGRDVEADVRARRRVNDAKRRARARKAKGSPIVVVGAVAAVPAGHERRLVVDWRTGHVAGAVVYSRRESASLVEATHLAACIEAGVWTPAVGRARAAGGAL